MDFLFILLSCSLYILTIYILINTFNFDTKSSLLHSTFTSLEIN